MVSLSGLRIHSLQALSEFLLSQVGTKLIVSDLSLGAWRTHQVAAEFSEQLGLPFSSTVPRRDRLALATESIPSFADVIGRFIDAEGRGDATTFAALEFASQISSVVEAQNYMFAVILPGFGLESGAENLLLIQFLAQAFRNTSARLFLISCNMDESPVPPNWNIDWANYDAGEGLTSPRKSLFGLFPGILNSRIVKNLEPLEEKDQETLFPLQNGYSLVAPQLRQDPKVVSRFDYDKLATATSDDLWAHAYSQVHGNNFYVDPWFLWSQALAELEAGGYSLAIRLVERGATCAQNPLQRGMLQALAQGIRIAAERFPEVMVVPDPGPGTPQNIAGFLLEAKGWALTMLDEPARAEQYFQHAQVLLNREETPRREYLYFLNIWALNRLKLGDPEGALAFEKDIETQRLQLPQFDWHLSYVNSINLARLYQRQAAFDRAESYYRKAFEATLGVRTDGDCLYTNLCLARVHEEQHRPVEAFGCRMRAALHWVSNPVPEALGRRIASAIVGRKVARGETDPEELSAALESRLIQAARAAGLDWIPGLISSTSLRPDPPVFLRMDKMLTGLTFPSHSTAVLGEGWSIIGTRIHLTPQLVSPKYQHLCSLLSEIVCAAFLPELREDFSTFIIDDGGGIEMPTTVSELVESCLRLQIKRLFIDGHAWEPGHEVISWLERNLIVRVSDAIGSIDQIDRQIVIQFKRYLPSVSLSEDQAQVLRLLVNPLPIEEVGRQYLARDFSELLRSLRAMEQMRLIRLELSNDAMKAIPGLLGGTRHPSTNSLSLGVES